MYTISLHECREYDYNKIKEIIKIEIDELGGLNNFINKGERVLIKPNLVMMKSPEKAATTHPYIVQTVAELVKEIGAVAIIADSPGGLFNEVLLKSVSNACNMNTSAEKSGAILNYNTKVVADVPFSEGFLLKRITVIDELLRCDKVINLCKLKTHGMMRMTCAVKNMFGIIPGTMKAEYHLNRSRTDDFANALIDICLFANPVLNIVDAIEGMEGNGPTGGNPRKIGIIMASTSPFALDIASAYVTNINIHEIPVCSQSIKRKLSPSSIDEITFLGDSIESFLIKDFKAPKTKALNITESLPKPIYKVLNNVLQPYPYFEYSKCISCKRCADNCPPNALTMVNGNPEFAKEKCIRCFCCQELCPALAIEIKKPILYTIFSSL